MLHKTVLLKEAVEALAIKPDGVYVDATLGRCGHSQAILDALGDEGRLISFDQDDEAIAYAQASLGKDERVTLVHQNFEALRTTLDELGLTGRVDGILFDLGICSTHVDDPTRGFSFMQDAPLDMRMDRGQKTTAADIIASYPERQLATLFKELGEEPFAKRIARAICEQRKIEPITHTLELAELVKRVKPMKPQAKIHAATLVFQALRLAVNRELDVLEKALESAIECLVPGGRLAVISFHSLEDRITKQILRKHATDSTPPQIPIEYDKLKKQLTLLGKPVRPNEFEIRQNPRARSAIMRVALKDER